MNESRRTLGACLLAFAACTYAPPEDTARVEQIVPLGDSFRALVVIRYDRFRRPTGLSAFPDGGKWRYEERQAMEYVIDTGDRTVHELARQHAADSVWESFDAHVRGVEDDSMAYLALTGCARGGKCYPGLDHTELIRLSVTGQARSVAEVPADAGLPGVMLARRPGETRYVRYGRDGDLITARFQEGAPYEPLFRLRPDGGLEPVAPQRESPR